MPLRATTLLTVRWLAGTDASRVTEPAVSRFTAVKSSEPQSAFRKPSTST